MEHEFGEKFLEKTEILSLNTFKSFSQLLRANSLGSNSRFWTLTQFWRLLEMPKPSEMTILHDLVSFSKSSSTDGVPFRRPGLNNTYWKNRDWSGRASKKEIIISFITCWREWVPKKKPDWDLPRPSSNYLWFQYFLQNYQHRSRGSEFEPRHLHWQILFRARDQQT